MSARVRTGYSFRSAVGDIEAVFKKQRELGYACAPITDTASAFGFVKWSKLCKKADVKPIFGVEIAVTDSINAKTPVVDFWTFLARDDISAVNELIGIATSQFRYRPLLSYDQAINAEGVFKIVGNRSIFRPGMFEADDIFVGLGPGVIRGYINSAVEAGAKLIAVGNNRYINEDDKGLYEVICGRSAETQSFAQHLLSDEEWRTSFSYGDDATRDTAIANRDAVFEKCTALLHPGTLLAPERKSTLRDMCIEGAAKLGCDLTDPVYQARMTRELDMIAEKKFEDYFYIIADICQWARQRMIVGPARGSSCGSLVCYLLGITTIDPIPYNLIFERFIDINRSDLPDIDIDFSDQKRQLVFDYVAEKYGKERVARLGTVAVYRPRSALQEAATALDIPPWKVLPVLDGIIERSSGDARALQATEDTLRDTPAGQALISEYPEIAIAFKMEGHPRHNSQHAAGIVLTERATKNYIAIDARTGATHCDKKDAEELNLLKIDALGLTQLSIFEDALELAALPRDTLFKVPLDDALAFEVLNRGAFAGIFQFNGMALQSLAQAIKTTDIEDIIAMTALARPGPLNSGGTNQWLRVKNGQSAITYPHPLFEPHLKVTLGVVAYQEQVMTIGKDIGDLSWDDVTALRKAMSKSLGKEFFDQYGDKWKTRAIEKGVPHEVAEKVWDDLCAYGSWAFNRSHAVAYGIVSYWCCWLKAHHAAAFAAATLSHTDSVDTQLKLLRELVEEGIDYAPFDAEFSTSKWSIGLRGNKHILVGPLGNVIGIGPKKVAEIMSARSRPGETLSAGTQKLIDRPRTKIDSIYPLTARMKTLCPDLRERNIHTPVTKIIDCQFNGTQQEVLVIATLSQIKPRDENEEMSVAKRGHRITRGPTAYLNLRITDDTDTMFAKIDRWNYESLGRPVVNRGRARKAIYAIKGTIPKGFRMISVKNIRYIGDMELNDDGTKAGIVVPSEVPGTNKRKRTKRNKSEAETQ